MLAHDEEEYITIQQTLFSPKAKKWFEALKDGFTMMEEDHYVYIKRSNNLFIILSLYVDDILIARNGKKLIYVTKKWLS